MPLFSHLRSGRCFTCIDHLYLFVDSSFLCFLKIGFRCVEFFVFLNTLPKLQRVVDPLLFICMFASPASSSAFSSSINALRSNSVVFFVSLYPDGIILLPYYGWYLYVYCYGQTARLYPLITIPEFWLTGCIKSLLFTVNIRYSVGVTACRQTQLNIGYWLEAVTLHT